MLRQQFVQKLNPEAVNKQKVKQKSAEGTRAAPEVVNGNSFETLDWSPRPSNGRTGPGLPLLWSAAFKWLTNCDIWVLNERALPGSL